MRCEQAPLLLSILCTDQFISPAIPDAIVVILREVCQECCLVSRQAGQLLLQTSYGLCTIGNDVYSVGAV